MLKKMFAPAPSPLSIFSSTKININEAPDTPIKSREKSIALTLSSKKPLFRHKNKDKESINK